MGNTSHSWRTLTQYQCPVCQEKYTEALAIEYVELVFETPIGRAKAVLCPTCSEAYGNSLEEMQAKVENLAYASVLEAMEDMDDA